MLKRVSFFCLASLFCSAAYPEVKINNDKIVANHRYYMGDNDSKSDAVALCYLEAKRQAIEYAGVVIESKMSLNKDSEGSVKGKSDIRSIASALVEAKQTSNNMGMENGRMYIDCEVVTKVDKSKISNQVVKIKNDPKIKPKRPSIINILTLLSHNQFMEVRNS